MRLSLILAASMAVMVGSGAQAADWVAASSYTDAEGKWTGETNAYDLNTGTYASDTSNRTGFGAVLKLNYATAVNSDRVRVYTDFGHGVVDKIKLTVIYDDNSTESHEFDGSVVVDVTYSTLTFTKGLVKAVEYSFHYTVSGWNYWLYELQLYQCPEDPDPLGGATLDPSSVNAASAVLHGSVTSNGGNPCYGRFVYWMNENNKQYTAWRGDLDNSQEFTQALSGLYDNTGYSYQAQLAATANPSEEEIVACSPVKTFTTVKVDETSSEEWVSPSSAWAGVGSWQDADRAMDDDTGSSARYYHEVNADSWSPYIHFSTDLQCNGIRLWAQGSTADQVDIDIVKDGVWQDLYQGVFTGDTWQQFPIDKGHVTEARIRLHAAIGYTGFYWNLMEVDFHQKSELRTTRFFVGTGSDWANSANWSETSGGTGGASVPGTGCVAVFDANSPSCALSGNVAIEAIQMLSGYTGVLDAGTYSITIERNRSFGELRVAGGELKLGSATHTIKDNLRVTGGTVTAQTSTVVFIAPDDGSFEIAGDVTLNNVRFYHSNSGSIGKSLSVNGTVTANGLLELFGYESGGHNLYLNGSGTVVAKGDIDGNGKVILGSANLTVAGSAGDQTQTNLNFGSNGTYTVDKPAGLLVWAGTTKFGGGNDTKLVLTTQVDATTEEPDVYFNGYAYGDVTITGDLTVYNAIFYRNGGTGTTCYNLGTSTLTVEHTLTLDMSASGGWHVIFAEGGTIACKGDVVCTSVVDTDWSGVNILINGTGNQSVGFGGVAVYKMRVDKSSGTTTFTSGFNSKHEFTVVAGNTVNFTAGSTVTTKTLDLVGASGNAITFRSTSDGTAWNMSVGTKYQTPTYVDVKDCDASTGEQVIGTACSDAGGNTNWLFLGAASGAFSSGTTSVTSPAWVYGTCGPNVTSLQMKVNSGTAFDVVRVSPMSWFADDSSAGGAAIGIGLSATAATGLELLADSQSAATQSITWTATDMTSVSSITIRKGDSLLLTAPGTGTLEIDANGDSTTDYTGQGGDNYAYQYGTAGVYSATAKIGGQLVGTTTVTVVEATLPTVLACQQGNSITRKITVSPGAEAANLTVNLSADCTVTLTPTVVSDGINVAFNATDVMGGRIFVRIGGADGPVLATDLVKPFKLVYLNPDVPLQEAYADGDGRFEFVIVMTPYVPEATLRFDTWSGGTVWEATGTGTMYKTGSDVGEDAFTFYMIAPRTTATTCHDVYLVQ